MSIKSTPIARALAAKMGIDISQVVGTGIDGRILMDDIKNFKVQPVIDSLKTPVSETVSSSVAPVVSNTLTASSEPISPIRKAIAKAMVNSWDNVAYTNLVHRIDMSNLWNTRNQIKDIVLKNENVKVTFLPYIIKASAIVLRSFPKFVAKYNETKQTLDYPGTINIGIAIDTEAGLMTATVNNADKLSVIDIAKEVSRLAAAARNKTLKPSDIKGAGFTLTNYGSVGSLWGVPVINYPELAIGGIGAIVDEAVIKNGQVVPGKIMYLTVAADHRWIDGAEIGKFASKVKELLENPELLGVY
ncbi:2-oxo acid dehydrogenase subunit E2 [Mycoplasmopsis felifaucium]|uniref:2-oxo acid dehydrogenase subunit E2 n=1 Tax=Mycoplasmopsis felifaucium TaxID=35768 RepID=A0ABZ2RX87_9BACT